MDAENNCHAVKVQFTNNFNGIKVSLPKLRKLAQTICKRFNLRKAVINIALVDDRQSQNINEKFLSKKRPTDVISFDLSDKDKEKTNPRLLELVVNAQMAAREAKARGHSDKSELALYITHGLLHHLGFNDSTKTGAKKMHEMENTILQELGFGRVYK